MSDEQADTLDRALTESSSVLLELKEPEKVSRTRGYKLNREKVNDGKEQEQEQEA